MSQLGTLIWLKWTLFRNSLRSSKAVAGSVASTLGTLAALSMALLMSVGLGVVTYFLMGVPREGVDPQRAALGGLVFLLAVFATIYLMWAIVPLGLGGGNQFDPGRLLLYPVSLRKLFALDFLSDLTSLTSIFAIPIVLAIALGAGLARSRVVAALLLGVFAVAFGIALVKLLGTWLSALMRHKRARGETLLALFGAVMAFFGIFFEQIYTRLRPHVSGNARLFESLWWTPPGAVASGLMEGLRAGGAQDYALALATLSLYTTLIVALTYRIAKRAALGNEGGGRGRKIGVEGRARAAAAGDEKGGAAKAQPASAAGGWRLPLLSEQLAAVVEKELRYVVRNAQMRLLLLMPLVLIGLRLMQRGKGRGLPAATDGAAGDAGGAAAWYVEAFRIYGDGLVTMGGVLYVFMLLSSLACNMFSFEEGGMRALILAPVERRTILLGKNISVTLIALLYSAVLLSVNHLIFRDVTLAGLAFTALCFIFFAATESLIGNWLSMFFPKRMPYGKRLNLSGVAGLLLLPMVIAMALVPLVAALFGYLAQSLAVKYATLAVFTAAALGLYSTLIGVQGRTLARRQIDILESIAKRTDV